MTNCNNMCNEQGCYSWQQSDGSVREMFQEKKITNLSGIKYHKMRYTRIHKIIQLQLVITISGNIYLIMEFITQVLIESPAECS